MSHFLGLLETGESSNCLVWDWLLETALLEVGESSNCLVWDWLLDTALLEIIGESFNCLGLDCLT